jgi:hypothetical protein
VDPAYVDLRLANKLPAWEAETYGKPLVAAVRDSAAAPYAADSDDSFMRRVLREEWPREVILDATARGEMT